MLGRGCRTQGGFESRRAPGETLLKVGHCLRLGRGLLEISCGLNCALKLLSKTSSLNSVLEDSRAGQGPVTQAVSGRGMYLERTSLR